MKDEPAKQPPVLTSRQLLAGIAALTLHAGINGAVPLFAVPHGPSDATEQAVERIGNELAGIRSSLVTTQLEMTKALATAMQELTDHSRRLERLEERARR